MNTKIEYLTAGTSATIEDLQSAIREVSIDNRVILKTYCANSKWYVEVETGNLQVKMRWDSFLEIFHDFSKFVMSESEILIHHKQDEL